MEAKNSELSKTGDALADLNEALVMLNAVIAAKKTELAAKEERCKSELKNKEQKLTLLKKSSEKIIGQIDGVVNRLDKVLENNGSSNDNN